MVINNPSKGVFYGGSIAGPVFKEVADKVYATRLNIVPKKDSTLKQVPIYASGNTKELQTLYKGMQLTVPDSAYLYEWAHYARRDDTIVANGIKVEEGSTPDVRGLGARDALYLLESVGLKVQLSGKGKVKKQSITPGSKVVRGSKCIIELG